MRIFLYEHVTGGGALGVNLPPSLLREGRAMLQAIATDLASIEKVSVDIMLEESLEARLPPAVRVHRVTAPNEARERFDLLARNCDGTLVIAPELGGELVSLARRVREVGGLHLGATPEAIELASDKLLLPRHLLEHGVPCIRAEAFAAGPHELKARCRALAPPWPAVVKPRWGAGSTETFLLDEKSSWPDVDGQFVITPFCPGMPTSMLAIVGPRGTWPLRAGEQVLSSDGRFRYLGGRMPLPASLEARAVKLALRALAAIPGLLGFAGVDLLLDREDHERNDTVVEINARLTTSYVGLRALSRVNLAACWLATVSGGDSPVFAWQPEQIRFHPDGSVEALK